MKTLLLGYLLLVLLLVAVMAVGVVGPVETALWLALVLGWTVVWAVMRRRTKA